MKALKIIGIVLAALIIVFLAVGLIVPSYEYQSSVQVNASPEKCWKVYHNTELMNQWLKVLNRSSGRAVIRLLRVRFMKSSLLMEIIAW